ncbi:relaxase/mobilization nuclease domain-containing protein (plasmid) [Pseudanabaena biceps]|nr:relaxase/mobilization nuclease domain-containing protein [Pseudanabaena biceps]
MAYVLRRPAFEIINMNVIGETASEIAAEFEMMQKLRPRLTRAVCHITLSISPSESLSDESWTQIIDRYFQEMGFTNNFFVAVKHNDKNHKHVHLVTSRIRFDGSVVSDSWDMIRSQKVIRKIEQDFGLTPVKNSWESDRHAPTKSQINKELETGIPTVKKQLADKIDSALANVTNMPALLQQLELDGIEVKISRDRQNTLTGISYKLDGVSMAGCHVGSSFSLPKILKRLESKSNQQEDAVTSNHEKNEKITGGKPNIQKAFDTFHIANAIEDKIKVGTTMPQFIEELKQSGIEAYVKFTRTNKIKGISYSIGSESIQGHELGKKYSWGGLQKYLQVNYDATRDNPAIKAMQSNDSKPVKRSVVSYQQDRQSVPENNLVEMVQEIARLRSLQPPEQIPKRVQTETENSDDLLAQQQLLIGQAHRIAAICHEMLDELATNYFGEEGKNNYRITRDGDRLTVQRLKGDLSVILEMSGNEIVYANLHQMDIRRFENAWQLKQSQQQSSSDRHPLIP